MVGISKAISSDLESEDPFKDPDTIMVIANYYLFFKLFYLVRNFVRN